MKHHEHYESGELTMAYGWHGDLQRALAVSRRREVLARRTRALFLNVRAAVEMAPAVAELMGAELSWDQARRDEEVGRFNAIAQGYTVGPHPGPPPEYQGRG